MVAWIALVAGCGNVPIWLAYSGFWTNTLLPLFSRLDMAPRPPRPWPFEEPPGVKRCIPRLPPAIDRDGHAAKCPEEMGFWALNCEPHEPPAHSRTPDPGR